MNGSTFARSAAVRPRVVPAPAYAIASAESSPELDYSGCVCPSLTAPHSGRFFAAQPFGSLLTARMSFQPRALSGQPSACAIGFHIAITSGDSTSGSPAGAIGLGWLRCQPSLSSVTYALDAGLNTTGWSLPSRIAVIASP